MITSAEINAMIAQQGQGQRQLGMPAPVAGMSQYPPQFNFGAMGPNYGAMGAGAAMAPMGAIAPTIGAVGMGAGLLQAGGMGAVWGAEKLGMAAPAWAGRFAGSRMLGMAANIDPMTAAVGGAFSGGMGAFAGGAGIGGVMGGMGMGAMGAMMNPVTLGAGAAMFAGAKIHSGFQQQQQINSQLSGFSFMNAASSTGRGFSVGQMGSIGSQMRGMQERDSFTSMGDMQSILQKFNDFGMGQSVQDAQDFSKRLKKMTETVTTMARVLGTTIDDASAAFGKLRSAGFYSPGDVMGAARQVRVSQSLGMSAEQAYSTMGAGAAMSRSMGMSGQAGAKASLETVQSLQYASRYGGSLSEQNLMDITGAGTGVEAQQAFGLNMTGKMSQWLLNSGAGSGVLAGMGEIKDGKFTGGINKGMSGSGLDELLGQGQRNLSGRDAGLTFTTKKKKIADAILKEQSLGESSLQIVKGIAGDKFGDRSQDDMVDILIEHQLQVSALEAEALRELAYKSADIKKGMASQARASLAQSVYELDVAQNKSIGGMVQKVKGGFADLYSPLEGMGGRMGTSFEQGFTRAEDRAFGRVRYAGSDSAQSATIERLARGDSTLQLKGAAPKQQAWTSEEQTRITKLRGILQENSGDLQKGGFESAEDIVMRVAGYSGVGIGITKLSNSMVADALQQEGYSGLAKEVTGRDEGNNLASQLKMQQTSMADVLRKSLVRGTKGTDRMGEKYEDFTEGGPGLSLLASMGRKGFGAKELAAAQKSVRGKIGVGTDDGQAEMDAVYKELGLEGPKVSLSQFSDVKKMIEGKNWSDIAKGAKEHEASSQALADFSSLALSMGMAKKGGLAIDSAHDLIMAAGSGNVAATNKALDTYVKEIEGTEDISTLKGLDDTSLRAASKYKRARAAKSDKELKDLGATDADIKFYDGDKEAIGLYLGRKTMLEGGGAGGGLFSDQTGDQLGRLLTQLTIQSKQTAEILQTMHGGEGGTITAQPTDEDKTPWQKRHGK